MLTRDEMVTSLKEGTCRVKFTKVNGDKRDMQCTLNDETIKQYSKIVDDLSDRMNAGDTKKKVNLNVIPVFDILAQDWRSFRVDSVDSFERVEA